MRLNFAAQSICSLIQNIVHAFLELLNHDAAPVISDSPTGNGDSPQYDCNLGVRDKISLFGVQGGNDLKNRVSWVKCGGVGRGEKVKDVVMGMAGTILLD